MAPRLHRHPSSGVAASVWYQGCWFALGAIALAASLRGQNLLWTDNDGKLELVRRAAGNPSFVPQGDKLVARDGSNFVLKSTAEYLPVKIAVLDQHFQKGARAISDDGVPQGRLIQSGRFVFTANLKADRSLDDVILALVLESKEIGNSIYVTGLDHLSAHQLKRVSIDVTTSFRLAGVRLAGVHLFFEGKEVFNATLPESKWTDALDQMVAKRVAAAHDADLKPLYVSTPVYPPTLKKEMEGKVIVACQIDQHGKVINPSVKSETNPAFGAAALEAIHQWRFVPRVRDGHAVEAVAEIPVDFPSS